VADTTAPQVHRVVDVALDVYGRPMVLLDDATSARASRRPPHAVLLESIRPTVTGFCTTCFERHLDRGDHAARRARSCSPMVTYLCLVNRDRSLRRQLISEIRRLEDLDRLVVS
jgi:hypothetical protein